MQLEFSSIAFTDLAKAEANLSELAQRLSSPILTPLASLLAASPDPDGALNLLERYTSRASADLLAELDQYPTALTYLTAIFGHSSSLAEAFLSEPGLPLQFARDRKFTRLKSREDLMQDYARFSTASPDPWISAQLVQFKRRTYLRIVLKDVLGISTLAETTMELSALADVIVTNSLMYCDQELRKRYGEPQYRDVQSRIARSEFSVISLGKMGGHELNYSSDIDLLFLYSHDGETAGGTEPDSVISNKEYFVRLANAITRTITQSTPHGQVFRVDLRLRPEGEMGDATISLKSALEYYEHRARDWELQMLIKARHSAGDERLTREFLRGVEARIYSSPTDFAAIETVLRSREKISRKLKESRSETIDVKRHRGGIRDIEFLTQCLQRLHGGHDPWVRSGGTLLALRKLNDKGWISDHDYAALNNSYEFLRKVEHRIQLDLGQQTHRLPSDPAVLDRLARRAGIDRYASPGTTLVEHLENIFQKVDEIYQKVIHLGMVVPGQNEYSLTAPPALTPEQAAASYENALNFLAIHAPELAERLRQASIPDRARKNAVRFLGHLLSSSELFAQARENPARFDRALQLIGVSEYLAELLIHHPEDLAALDSNSVSSSGAAQLDMALEGDCEAGSPLVVPADPSIFPWTAAPGWGLREEMALLRRHYRAQKLVLSSRDCGSLGSVFTSLKNWSALARRAISTALAAACAALKLVPETETLPDPSSVFWASPFVILSLGRLGVNEFDLASDADLIFVGASGASPDQLELWTRVAEKTIEILSSYTRDGAVFSVDTRLRPLGQEGELVVTEEAFLNYLEQQAKVWEGLTYVKACPVAGAMDFGREVALNLARTALTRFGGSPDLEGELHQMRRRLERERSDSPSDLKMGPGGYYDVDFALGYLRLRHQVEIPPGANSLEQLCAIRKAGAIGQEDAAALVNGAAFLRAVDHAVRLVTGKPPNGLPEHLGHAALVEGMARRWGLLKTDAGEQPLSWRLREVQQEVRYVYRRVVESE
jgi:[glutamine synthetase] adenylyltransferase / [glutamine synthetase]-adenylyl-L-tyrosine phosphorylase